MRTLTIRLATAVVGAALFVGCFSSSNKEASPDAGLDFDSGSDVQLVLPDTGTAPDVTQTDSGQSEGGKQEGGQDAGGTFTTSPVSFGLANCGGQPSPATQTYTFDNTGPVPVTWSATVGTPVFAIQGPSSGTVAPGGTGSITVGVTSVPATSTAGVDLTDTLTLTTNVPGYTTVAVPLNVTPQGGSLTLSSPPAFGSVTVGTTNTQPFTLQNVGNAAVSVTVGAPTAPQFGLTYTGTPAAASLAAGASLPGASATFSPTAVGVVSATSSIQVTGVLCASPATSIPLLGTGTTAPVSVSPGTLDFNTVACGQTAPAQVVTLKNINNIAVTYTASLGKGASSPYLLSAQSGSVTANGTTTFNVAPLAIPIAANLTPGFYDDTLTVTPQGETPVVISLSESAGGAILALAMPTSSFGTVANTTATLPFTITNTGNQAATASAVVSSGFTASLPVNTVPATNGTTSGTVSFTAASNTTATGTLSVTASNLCAPLPAAVTLSAVGEVPVLGFPNGKGPIAISSTCGGAATGSSITLTNTGTIALTLSNVVSVNGDFTVGAFTNPIPASGKITIPVTAVTLAAGAATNPSGGTVAADTLKFSTDEPGAPSYSVTVDDTIIGANVVVTPSVLTFKTCGNVSFSVDVTGVVPKGDTVTAMPNANYGVGDIFPMGFGGGLGNGITVTSGTTLPATYPATPDSVYSNEDSNCTPETVTFLTTTGPVCHAVLSISATYASPGACTNCGADHS